MVWLGLKPGATEWTAQTNPLSTPLQSLNHLKATMIKLNSFHHVLFYCQSF